MPRETLASSSSSTSSSGANDPPPEDAWVDAYQRLLRQWQSLSVSPQRLLFQYEPELDAFLEFLIWRFSIWVDMPTPGNALMNLRYREERAIGPRGKAELQQRIERVTEIWGPNGSQPLEMDYKEGMGKIRKEIVSFHGEMVLLMNYSNINYTDKIPSFKYMGLSNNPWLAKISKKYDKRTGGLLRSPFIQNVLQQLFYTIDLILKLLKECESTIHVMFPVVEEEGIIRGEREAITVSGEGAFRNTVAALLTMQEIRRGSSTYGHFYLSPLNLPDSDFIQSFQLNSPIPIP
ncbi:unnamed protein product [Camellia sinensis]